MLFLILKRLFLQAIMIRLVQLIIALLLGGYSVLNHGSSGNRNDNDRLRIAEEMKASMVNELLKPWYPQSADHEYGGFLSAFTYDFKPTGNQDKMIVTQARHVWSNSKAAEIFPRIDYYKADARNGYEFLKNKMWDHNYGGFYTLVDRQGNVKQSGVAAKDAYGNSFGLYALAAYYQASGDTGALQLAKQAFGWLEKHSHDPLNKGYFQHLQRDGTPIKRGPDIATGSDLGYKDQNSSIHLLESLTELYTVWPDSLVRVRLDEMRILVRDIITTPKGNLILFFKPDWTPVSFRDSADAVIIRYKNLDHVSFGHDIETAYLLQEAAHALGYDNETATVKTSKKMLDHALANGWDNNAGGFYDEGYYFKNKPGITIIADTKNWWAQAEGLNTLLLMAEQYPNDAHRYFDKFKMQWNYIKTYLIDHEHGDWYQGGIDKEPNQKTALKGHIWKGTYHNLRSLMNCIQHLDPDTVAPSVPSDTKLERKNDALLIKWKASTDNKHVLGYNIYINKLRAGFTPLTYFSFDKVQQLKTGSIVIEAVDVQGNASAPNRAVSF